MSQQSILSRTLAALPLALLSGAALAQAQPGAAPGEGSAVHFIVFLAGLGLAAYWSVEAFARPAVLADLPTPPRYMTRSRQYKAGLCAFVGLSLLFYGILAYGHRDALPAVRLLNPSLYEIFAKEVEGNTPNYLLIVALLSGAFLGLLKLEAEWNPLFVLRRLILRWVAVPELANELMQRGESALVVPPSGQAMVIGNPATPHVVAEDFRKDRQSLDRIWAELAYMYAWLDRQDEDGVDATFFAEPSFGWRQLQQDFANAAARVAPLKTGQGGDQPQFAAVHELVAAVRRRMCRLLACYLVYRHDTEEEVAAQARAFGIAIPDCACENPLRYAILYIVAIGVSVWLSVNFSAAFFDLVHGAGGFAALAQDPDLVMRWVGYSAANIGMPIVAILAARCIGWLVDPRRRGQSYLVSYCWVFLIAFCAAPLSLAGAVKLFGAPASAALPYLDLVLRSVKWAVTPALIAVYVVYYLDRRIDPRLPDVDREGSAGARLLNAFVFAVVVMVLVLPPTASIHGTGQPPVWPDEKLRWVAIGTTFFVAFALACVAQFALTRVRLRQADAAPLPPAGVPAG
jgi:hypothetical protein